MLAFQPTWALRQMSSNLLGRPTTISLHFAHHVVVARCISTRDQVGWEALCTSVFHLIASPGLLCQENCIALHIVYYGTRCCVSCVHCVHGVQGPVAGCRVGGQWPSGSVWKAVCSCTKGSPPIPTTNTTTTNNNTRFNNCIHIAITTLLQDLSKIDRSSFKWLPLRQHATLFQIQIYLSPFLLRIYCKLHPGF